MYHAGLNRRGEYSPVSGNETTGQSQTISQESWKQPVSREVALSTQEDVINEGRFIRRDEKYNYISGRFPPDAQLLAKETIEMVKNVTT